MAMDQKVGSQSLHRDVFLGAVALGNHDCRVDAVTSSCVRDALAVISPSRRYDFGRRMFSLY
jgi:hypothetical protein